MINKQTQEQVEYFLDQLHEHFDNIVLVVGEQKTDLVALWQRGSGYANEGLMQQAYDSMTSRHEIE